MSRNRHGGRTLMFLTQGHKDVLFVGLIKDEEA